MSGFNEERADIVAQNGNDGLHYDAETFTEQMRCLITRRK